MGSVVTHPLDKYCIVELMTRKGSFKVSACHRIAVAVQDGFPADARAAAELAIGDRVFMGTRALPLTRISHFDTRTELISVAFSPDVPVESFIVPCGMQTHGEILPCEPFDFSAYSEADLQQAMPVRYDD